MHHGPGPLAGKQHEQHHATRDHDHPVPIGRGPAAPHLHDRAGQEQHQQQHAGMAQRHPRIRHGPGRHRDGIASPDRQRPQRFDRPEVQVLAGEEVGQQACKPCQAGGRRQRDAPGTEVHEHEADEASHQHHDRDMGPAHQVAVLVRGACTHQGQFDHRDHCHRDGGQREQEVGVLAPLPGPDDQMDGRERQARGGDHGPQQVDPAHAQHCIDPVGERGQVYAHGGRTTCNTARGRAYRSHRAMVASGRRLQQVYGRWMPMALSS